MRKIMRTDLFMRFWKKCKINNENDCWEWQSEKTGKGYGRFNVSINNKIKHFKAHRISYELCVGTIPPEMMVCHHCDNPCCVNPEHLFLGTNTDNIADMMKKNRQRKGENHGRNKLSLDEVLYIKKYPKYHGSGVKLAEQFGVSATTIFQIRNDKRWKFLKL